MPLHENHVRPYAIGFPFAVILLGVSAFAQPTPTNSAPPPSDVDAIFAQYDHTNTPGCALGVFRGGQIVYARGYGMADLNQGIAITPQTVFYIASTSKQFTAMSVLLASQQGRLALDDPIRKYVPELPAYADAITVRHLVHHLSGIRDYLGLWSMAGRSFADQIVEDEALALIARQLAPDFAPAAQWSYSNSGYFLLSVIVKRATGLTLRVFAERNIFAPLGMTSTHFHDDNQEVVARRAEGYEKGSTGYRIVRTSFALVGDGGLYTTIEDLQRWDENFYQNRLGGGQALIDQMLTKGRLANGKETNYAFGLTPDSYRGLPIVQHGGSFIGYRAQLLRFPGEHFSVAVLCNEGSAAPEQLALRVADRYLAAKLASLPVVGASNGGTASATIDPARLDRLAGRYELAAGMVGEVKREGAAIAMRAFGLTLPLTSVSDTVFTTPMLSGRVIFHPAEGGGVSVEVEALGGAPAPRLGPAPVLDATALAAYSGRYRSAELDTWSVVEVRDGRLQARTRYGSWVVLEALSADAFVGGGTRLVFTRDRRGKVTGYRQSGGRMTNIVFVRD